MRLWRRRDTSIDRYWIAYGKGAHNRVSGGERDENPYTYGTSEHDAWNCGFEQRP